MATIDINKSLSAKIIQARNPKSFKGATIIVGEAEKVVRELRAEHFSGNEIRGAIDAAAEDGKLTDPEVKLFQERIDNLFGKSMPVPATAKTIASEKRYGQLINEVAVAMTKKQAQKLEKVEPKFAQPAQHTFNPTFWKLMPPPEATGTFNPVKRPSAAVRDILDNPSLYAYDCATGAVAATYMALVKMLDAAVFDQTFDKLYIGPRSFDPQLQRILDKHGSDDLSKKGNVALLKPGDIVYFNNPGALQEHVDEGWKGENAIYLGDGKYYAHPLGIKTADEILADLLAMCPPFDDPDVSFPKPYFVSRHWRPNMSKVGELSQP